LALLLELPRILARATVRPASAVDDDLDVRVVLVVLEELLVQLLLELRWHDAVDHALSVRMCLDPRPSVHALRSAGETDAARKSPQSRAMSGTMRPSSARWAFHSVNEPSSSPSSCPRPARRTGRGEA